MHIQTSNTEEKKSLNSIKSEVKSNRNLKISDEKCEIKKNESCYKKSSILKDFKNIEDSNDAIIINSLNFQRDLFFKKHLKNGHFFIFLF